MNKKIIMLIVFLILNISSVYANGAAAAVIITQQNEQKKQQNAANAGCVIPEEFKGRNIKFTTKVGVFEEEINLLEVFEYRTDCDGNIIETTKKNSQLIESISIFIVAILTMIIIAIFFRTMTGDKK